MQSIQKIFTCLLLAPSDRPPLRLAFHARYPTRSLDVKEGCRQAKTSASPCEATAANCRLPATPPPTIHTSTPGTDWEENGEQAEPTRVPLSTGRPAWSPWLRVQSAALECSLWLCRDCTPGYPVCSEELIMEGCLRAFAPRGTEPREEIGKRRAARLNLIRATLARSASSSSSSSSSSSLV